HGMMRSAPAWTIRSTANSERSDFGSAWAIGTGGVGCGNSCSSETCTPAAENVPRTAGSTPSLTMTASPSAMRLTWLWRASDPVSWTESPTATPWGRGWMNTDSVTRFFPLLPLWLGWPGRGMGAYLGRPYRPYCAASGAREVLTPAGEQATVLPTPRP